MRKIRGVLKKPSIFCFVLIFLSFFFSSSAYLSWLYHMMTMTSSDIQPDFFSMVLGYLFQAAGVLLFALMCRNRPKIAGKNIFIGTVILFTVCIVPAIYSNFLAGVLIFGLAMNMLCGILAGFYLYLFSRNVEKQKRGLVFGMGYGMSTIAAWLISMIGPDNFLKTGYVMILYVVLAAALIYAGARIIRYDEAKQEAGFGDMGGKRTTEAAGNAAGGRIGNVLRIFNRQENGMASKEQGEDAGSGEAVESGEVPLFLEKTDRLVFLAVLLLSLVKNLGFGFPSVDIAAGNLLEFSRIFYAAGLVTAGFVSDKNRKYGAVCTVGALIIPFVMLSLVGESVPAAIFWSLDYLFFGFFSVYRVVVFSDLAESRKIWHLGVLGLFSGRLGDAVGTGICLGLGNNRIILILTAAGLFVLTVFVFFQMYQILYQPEVVRQKSEEEVFEDFSARHDLSAREKEVFRLMIRGHSNSEIAADLFVSESTVKFHVHNILKKTGCKTRVELVGRYKAELYDQEGEAGMALSQ